MPESYLIIGGSGFLGRHVVERLIQRGEHNVAVFDIVQKHFDVPFYSGDITKEEDINQALTKSGTTCIIHTASPPHGLKPEVYWKCNEDGTKVVIEAAVAHGVKKLVYTSSAGTVFDGNHLINCDERMPEPDTPLDAYNASKARGESLVLEANGKGGLLTCAIRPSGIFGPNDKQLFPGILKAIKAGRSHFQVGPNTRLFDFTYVTNVADALILAADKLENTPLDPYDLAEPLPVLHETRKIPTSVARPLGPTLNPTPEAEAALKAFQTEPEVRPLTRSKFDPLGINTIELESTSPLQVAGQAFFITNAEPVYFWDFARSVCKEIGFPPPTKITQVPKSIMMVCAELNEWYCWITGVEPELTRYRLTYTCTNRWYNVEKARRVLGYSPEVSMEEGIKKLGEWYKAEQAAGISEKS